MSLPADPQHPAGVSESVENSAVSTEALIGLLGDDYALTVLGAIHHEAKSARAIAEECGVSRPTVYRRLNRLRSAGFVSERMEYGTDGHHRSIFVATVERVGLELGEDGLEAALETSEPGASDPS